MNHTDVFGQALKDYYNHLQSEKNKASFENIITWTNISEEDELPLPYLFRPFEDMPKIEQTALRYCRGKTLDVGCGAGSHSLWLQENGFKVKAVDISEGAVSVCRKRGVKNVECKSILEENEMFDTILLLMNGTGIFQKFSSVESYLLHLKSMLKAGGQILIDSSDIKYMYDKEDLENISKTRYYGELDYFIKYKDDYEYPMTWLYLDLETLKRKCKAVGLKCQKIADGEHFDYLARITYY